LIGVFATISLNDGFAFSPSLAASTSISTDAGWEPVTYATSNSNAVQLQRFGRGENIYLTVWGPNPPASVEIEVDAAKLGLKAKPSFSEMVANTPIKVTPSAKGWKLTVPLEKDMTRVIKIN